MANRLTLLATATALLLIPAIQAQEKASKKSYDRGRETLKLDLAAAEEYTKNSPKPLPETRFGKLDPAAKSFDWTKKIATVGLQRQSGSKTCWAHAVTAALEWNWAIRNTPGKMPNLSAQPIIDRAGVEGGHPIADAFEILLYHGTALESDYLGNGHPGQLRKVKTPYRIVAWASVDPKKNRPTVEQIKDSLVRHGPLTASVYASPAFKKYKSGLFSEFIQTSESDPTTHYVLIVGWDDSKGKKGAWKIQNSWGAKWGERGFMWIEYGCNNIGYNARWMRAQSIHYPLPADAHTQLKDAAPFPAWTKNAVAAAAVKIEAPPPAKPAAEETSGEESISPGEVKDRLGDRVWLRMSVAVTATNPQGQCEFYSQKNWQAPENVIVRIPKEAFAAFNVENAKGLRERYRGKKILVEGKVEKVATKEGERLMISVSAPKQIVLVSDDE